MSRTTAVPVRRLTAAAAALAVVGATLLTATAPGDARDTTWERVIVTGTAGGMTAVEHAVTQVGGRISRTLGVVDGVVARVPAARVDELRRVPRVRSVSPDAAGRLMSVDPSLGYDVTGDGGSLFAVAQAVHATDAWQQGVTGAGVDVALIDSGVTRVSGLASGNVVDGPDVSSEAGTWLAHRDGFGHGTHMASIIAGRDAPASGPQYADAARGQFTGIAPDARVVNVKAGAFNGTVDVSQVIAAIDWVTEHAHDPGFNIRVLNLSFGTDSVQRPQVDPLDYAVENAWRAGITVVVSGGNDGTDVPRLADPANDPLVIAVGADDANGTISPVDDTVPAFSQRGSGLRHVDLIAPGVHVLGLRAPWSLASLLHPEAAVGTRFLRGSGTSQAAAVVSGLAALYLSAHPDATPDDVKAALTASATLPRGVNLLYTGAGVPDVARALAGGTVGGARQQATGATGTGSLEASRGSLHVYNGTGIVSGERDVFGRPWNGAAWAAASAAGTAWGSSAGGSSAWGSSAWGSSAWGSSAWGSSAWGSSAWGSSAWGSAGWR